MAYTVNQETTGVQGAWDELIYVVADPTQITEPNYRFVCQVTINGSVVITMKQLPNNAGAAVFEISDIARAYVQQDLNPFQLGQVNMAGDLSTTTIYGLNEKALITVTTDFGYEFTTTANQPPVQVIEPGTTQSVFVVNGSFQETGSSLPLPIAAASEYKMTVGRRFFLSDAHVNQDVVRYPVQYQTDSKSYAALAFLNGDDVGSTGPDYMHVTFYNQATQLSTGFIQNTTITGGKAPASGLTDEQSLLYVGVGPANLDSQNIATASRPSANAGWTHYDIQMASSITLAGNQTSYIYRFERLDCLRYQENNYQLFWWNSKGGVDSLPFTGKSMQSQDMKKAAYRTSGGNSFSATGLSVNAYKKGSNEGGLRSGRIETTTTLELTTANGSPEILSPLVQSLVNSERVYLYGKETGLSEPTGSSGLVQVMVRESQIRYTKGVNDGLESYKVNIEISRRRPNA